MSLATDLLEDRMSKLDAEISEKQDQRAALQEAVDVLRKVQDGRLVPRSIDDAFGRPAPRPIKDSPQA